MSLLPFLLLLALATLGHSVWWVSLVNRLHAVRWPRRIIDSLTILCGVALVGCFLGVTAALWAFGWQRAYPPTNWILTVSWGYVFTAALYGLFTLIWQAYLATHKERRGGLVTNHTAQIDVGKSVSQPLTAPGIPALLAGIPGNQMLRPCFHEKEIALPRLRADQDGLKIAHVSDLHMSGRITKSYFVDVLARVNDWQPDLIALTGDLVERHECLDWIPDTLGLLKAHAGVYFVLGNHDRRVGSERLRKILNDVGLINLGGTWREVTVNGTPIVLAGNELPWFPPAADLTECPPHGADGLPLRILLSHSPDQFSWAAERDIDLMLAGHTHGGQVRMPLIGAILAPSVHGTRYVHGVFRKGETVMHVSRGTSGLAPFRFNCPPEVALLTVRSAQKR